MTFDIITLFPEVIRPYLEGSIIGRAVKNKLISVKVLNPRDFSTDKHRKADGRAYGGGPGMVMRVEPLIKAFRSLKLKIKNSKLKILITAAGGKSFDDAKALQLAKKYDHLVILCGHYEGIDARVPKILKDMGFSVEEVSIGPYVLTGGELPALVMIDSVSRKLEGVLGKSESLEENRLGVGVPAYTRPEVIKHGKKRYAVPKILLSGHHKNIEEWRKRHKS
ncbi:MAG: tRNA (guanosine(37)-N1)-methyltransferase TrmD [Candidatus Colwellbacteria bacterium RIFCSPLOWO2_01_FULL_48_10]|uniref:tRNA (guanine-N(1)-)-methyltransferase n=2 Tax=Bacteria candidate phyla TaxID=1783234 RepID=A0A1F5NYG8_9BACT|nr:MAG: tRNA (guanosine(37)-N1)-methyltransferase TrmD [Candidatus Doudnabacteria bacterium RIFCSPHIGHO2_01_FULL_49_9]OGY59670.1 MAG: tRNA (guanosine(37)-N1)-methyltransferase TrmD [Candidatus Colwellbacteria bacterium RIFCSPLOWO2_01_FULL_48_10]